MIRGMMGAILLAGCSHHPPIAQVYQQFTNPLCIIRCEAKTDTKFAQGESHDQSNAIATGDHPTGAANRQHP